jgi:sRNA-binding carbon storage regulator CsrA
VQKITIRYESREAAFVGAETLVSSLGRVLSTRRLTVTVTVDPPRPVTTNRKEFAQLIAPSSGDSQPGSGRSERDLAVAT